LRCSAHPSLAGANTQGIIDGFAVLNALRAAIQPKTLSDFKKKNPDVISLYFGLLGECGHWAFSSKAFAMAKLAWFATVDPYLLLCLAGVSR